MIKKNKFNFLCKFNKNYAHKTKLLSGIFIFCLFFLIGCTEETEKPNNETKTRQETNKEEMVGQNSSHETNPHNTKNSNNNNKKEIANEQQNKETNQENINKSSKSNEILVFYLGNKEAKVKIIEYFSLTCVFCKRFHEQTLPSLKENYIDKGLVYIEFRDMPLDNRALFAALTARCIGRKNKDHYAPFLDILYKNQNEWIPSKDLVKTITKYTKIAGLSKDDFDSCISDKGLLSDILSIQKTAQKKYNVNATPTLFINGDKLPGFIEYSKLKEIIENKIQEN